MTFGRLLRTDLPQQRPEFCKLAPIRKDSGATELRADPERPLLIRVCRYVDQTTQQKNQPQNSATVFADQEIACRHDLFKLANTPLFATEPEPRSWQVAVFKCHRALNAIQHDPLMGNVRTRGHNDIVVWRGCWS